MTNEFDVIVIGGGIIGLATAYYLTRQNQSVLVLEKEYIGAGSTGRCISGVRAQFSTETSIKIAMHSIELFKRMENDFGFPVEWAPSGYLFLAHDAARKAAFEKVLTLQRQLGLEVRLLTKAEITDHFPYLNATDLIAGTFCPSDGQADPFKVLKGYFLGIKKLGGVIKTRTEVIGIESKGVERFQVVTRDGERFQAPKVLNAAGPYAREVGQMVGLSLPVEPERHEALITEPVEYMHIPMIVDYRADGGYFVQRLTGQFVGCYTPVPRVPGHDLSSSLEFLSDMPRRMMRLVPALRDVAVVRQWGGSYSMTPDGNPIVDETEIPGFFVSAGMCGHGFMLGPALGQYLAEFMLYQKWPFDMSELAYLRDFNRSFEALK